MAVVVPLSVPAPAVSAAVTVTPLWATRFPLSSVSWSTGWGANATPLCAEPGSGVEKASLAGAPTATLNGVLVAALRPGEVTRKVYPVPGRFSVRSLKVAMPLVALIVVVPPSVVDRRRFSRS